MRTLADYLDLTPEQARDQWLRVRQRVPRKRQEAFLPVEAVLCFGLFFVVNPHQYGGQNIHRAPAPVHQLAQATKRTPGSITSKMLNLDGSRAHGQAIEPKLYLRLLGDGERFRALYLLVLHAAWQAKFTQEEVPDFLGLLDRDLVLLGQDEIGPSELSQAMREAEPELGGLRDALSTEEAERLVERPARVGQHRFAKAVLEVFDWACGFCGFQPKRLLGHRLLVASHIKPWIAATPRERLDPRNGIAACPIHDAAFDTGLLTVNGGLRVHRAEPLELSLASDVGVADYFGSARLRNRLVLPSDSDGPLDRYLKYHQQHIYKGPRPSS